jgi:DNA-binding transcriptional LysR family regulator
MDSLAALLAFAHTAETLSFVQAARRLGISPSAVGKSVARLEQRVGVRLFHRSTRRVSLTSEGQLFFEHCQRILAELRDAEAMLIRTQERPRGRLRISLPTAGYRFLMPLLPEFARRYSEIELDLDFNDRIVDVIAEGVDAVIRSGVLPDSQLVSRRLGAFRFVLCASPAYLAKYGVPEKPEALREHRCLRFRFPTSGKLQDWVFSGSGHPSAADYPTALVANNMEAVLTAALRGLGIAYMPAFLASEALAAGHLKSILEQYIEGGGDFWLLWPAGRQSSPKVRAFIDFLVEARVFK